MKLSKLALGLVVIGTACSSTGSVSSFKGAPFPVMLGPKRLGPTVEAKKVDDWYAEAVNFASQVDSGAYRITTVNTAPTSFMGRSSTKYVNNMAGGLTPDLDLQVTEIKGTAYVTAMGGAKKEIMYVAADIVRRPAPVAAAAPAPAAAAPAETGGAK